MSPEFFQFKTLQISSFEVFICVHEQFINVSIQGCHGTVEQYVQTMQRPRFLRMGSHVALTSPVTDSVLGYCFHQ